MYTRLGPLWGARAPQAVLMRMPSSTPPRRAASCADDISLGCRSWPPRWPRCAVWARLKTRNQLIETIKEKEAGGRASARRSPARRMSAVPRREAGYSD
jgi:hypothetical protein